jgi:sugar phosphate isomerase/epimerase
MNNAIVGYSGFVGMNLLQLYKFEKLYNSKNFYQAKGKKFNKLFFCGIPAVKWKANKNPVDDKENIENIKKILNTIEVKKIIVISTIDVYDNINNKFNENYIINPYNNHPYGKNRFLFEEYIKINFNDYNIIRLPALFGKGIKKNIIYDLLYNNNVNNIPINSKFQWYYLDWLKKDIEIILKHNIKVCNLFTEPIDTKDITELFKNIYDNDVYDSKKYVEYNTCTKYNNLFGCKKNYIRLKHDILKDLNEFIIFEKMNKSKLCVSNICVNNISQLQFIYLLKLYGIKNIQIAPTKLIKNWDEINLMDLSIYEQNNINVNSFQSITYTLKYNIFNKEEQEPLYKHLINVIDCAIMNKVKFLVFGCPKNRRIINNNENNEKIFILFFKKLSKYLENKDLIICIENNSKKYNCNFINTISECDNIVKKINSKNIKMMVDIGNVIMENDNLNNLKESMDIIYKVDVSNPHMENFTIINESHKKFSLLLKNNNYNHSINLEMLINDDINELNTLTKSLYNFVSIYSDI